MKKHEEKRMNEIICFLSLCGEKDRGFLEIPQEERRIDDYARLIAISLIFGFKKVSMQLVCEAGNRMKEVNEILKNARNDFHTVKMWMDEFIENIASAEMKTETQNIWDDVFKKINKENFNINQLI